MRKAILTLGIILSFSFSLSAAPAFDYNPWHKVLKNVVTEKEGFVNYEQLRKDPSNLDAFLKQAEEISPNNRPDLFPTREDKLVYWLQVYNALAMKNVLNFWPIKKTSDKKLRFFVFTKFDIGGERYSLKSYEDKAVREAFQEPRVHFFLNCASYSCPKLYREPLKADQLDKQLDRFARNFLNDPDRVKFDQQSGVLWLSKILYWYRGDFMAAMPDVEGKEDKVIAFINQFRDKKIPVDQVKDIKYFDYNWTVNDVKNL